jgi:hypothetical protein
MSENGVDVASRWGLPPGFVPVRHPIDDEVKEVVRGELSPGEPVVITLANEEGTVSIIATPQRLLSVRSGGATAGVTGFNVRDFPWEGITKLVLQQASTTLKFAIHYKTSDGRKVEVGRRAALAMAATENLMPFDPTAGHEVFAALYQIWEYKTQGTSMTL